MHSAYGSALVAGLALLAPAVSSLRVPAAAVDPLFHSFSFPSNRVIAELDCLSCPFVDASDSWQANVDSKIHLEFDASAENGLTLNLAPLASPGFNPSVPAPFELKASQIRASDGLVSQPVELGYTLVQYDPVVSQSGDELLFVRFTITHLRDKAVQVDSIAIDLLRNKDQLIILNFAFVPNTATPATPATPIVPAAPLCQEGSKLLVCRIKGLLDSNLQRMMEAARHHSRKLGLTRGRGGCRGHKHGGDGEGPIEFVDEEGPNPHAPGHFRKHRHDHGRMHKFGRVLHHAMRYFFIPATLGIIGGLVASAVGMLVVQLFMCLWQTFFPSRSEGGDAEDTIQVLIVREEGEEQPPQYYDHPPQYNAVEIGEAEKAETPEKN